MTIGEIVRQGLRYTRTCTSLWLFGFFVGAASSGPNVTFKSRGGGTGTAGGGLLHLSGTQIALIASLAVLAAATAFVMRFVAEGALIEGVVRARRGGTLTLRDGFRTGWAHWGVLVRIALLYIAATLASLGLLAAPCVIAMRALGPLGGLLLGLPLLFIAVPWLVTLYLVQAFAFRIAMIENRHALDAIGKARLFLHGRLIHGLKLMVATLAGTLALVILGLLALAPVALVLAALIPVLRVFPLVILACLALLPPICVLTAIVGTYRSSIWTIGYLTQVEP